MGGTCRQCLGYLAGLAAKGVPLFGEDGARPKVYETGND